VELLFPKKESHFDGLELQSELSKKQNVKILKTAYIHGFMNSRSANYSPTGSVSFKVVGTLFSNYAA